MKEKKTKQKANKLTRLIFKYKFKKHRNNNNNNKINVHSWQMN